MVKLCKNETISHEQYVLVCFTVLPSVDIKFNKTTIKQIVCLDR